MGPFGFDNRLMRVVLDVERCFDVVLIKCSFKLLTDSLDVRRVDAFGLLRFFFWVLSWLFSSPVVLFDFSLAEFFSIAVLF